MFNLKKNNMKVNRVSACFIIFCNLLMAGCGSTELIFMSEESWKFTPNGVTAVNELLGEEYQFCDWGSYEQNLVDTCDAHFVAKETFNKSYCCYKFINRVISSVPLDIDTVYFVAADRFVVARLCKQQAIWKPDYDFQKNEEGKYVSWCTESRGYGETYSTVPQTGHYWRNLIKLSRLECVVCVDRFIINNKLMAVMYAIPSDSSELPYGCHWTTTRFSNCQLLADILKSYSSVTERIIETNTKN